MKRILLNSTYCLISMVLLAACGQRKSSENTGKDTDTLSEATPKVIQVAAFKGKQVTGVTVSETGRIFANFPRWRKNVPFSVVEVDESGQYTSYPNEEMNAWTLEMAPSDSMFLGVQSVVASKGKLYVLDTRNPQFSGVKDAPRVFVIDLNSNKWIDTYVFDTTAYQSKSYINDLRVDEKKQRLYFTDSGLGALVMYDMKTATYKRILEDDPSTHAESDHLVMYGKKWERSVHSDGIALDTVHDKLFYHSLTGHALYALPTSAFDAPQADIKPQIEKIGDTPAPDGMILDDQGNLYMADLENGKIVYRTPNGKIATLVEGDKVKWADTFSIHDGILYYTNSRIHEVSGDISDMVFTINKIAIQ